MQKQKTSTRKSQQPRITEMPSQKMAVVYSHGDPNVVGEKVFPALYGAVYTLKFALKKQGIDMKVGPPRAQWPDVHIAPKDQWTGIWGLPIPEGTTSLSPKQPEPEVRIERWEYGTVAEILHLGQYSEEMLSIQRLHQFIDESGYEIAGPHEEEYLTTPRAKVPKTIIRYRVKKRS